MDTDITTFWKPEYPVVDRNPHFNKVVGNFNTRDYLSFVTITGVPVIAGYLSGDVNSITVEARKGNAGRPYLSYICIKYGTRGPFMVTGGLVGVLGGFIYAYRNSAGRLMGFFPNDGEVAQYKK